MTEDLISRKDPACPGDHMQKPESEAMTKHPIRHPDAGMVPAITALSQRGFQ